jgi:hypothetical protein
MHDFFVRYIAIGKNHLVDSQFPAQGFQLAFIADRDAVGIKRPGQLGRVAPAGYSGNLGRGKSDNLDMRVAPVAHIEIMEIPSSGAEDQQTLAARYASHASTLQAPHTFILAYQADFAA